MQRFDLAWWVRVEWGEHVPSVADIMQCLDCVEVLGKARKMNH